MTAPWYQRALDFPSTPGTVEVDGTPIYFETWGEVGKPGIVLIHGSNAHLEWWRFVAPFLADQFRVAALDSSGNGNSGWRDEYTAAAFANEVWGVCEAAQLGPRPVVVGHSFGGFVALETAHRFGEQLAGTVFMDFSVLPPEQYMEWGRRAEREGAQPGRKTRVYDDRAVATGRFRLLPDQPTRYPEIMAHLAEHSLREVDGGWTWKFDPTLFDHMEMGIDQRDKFVDLKCHTALIMGEDSGDEGAEGGPYLTDISDGLLPIFNIPTTHHHLMFDEPMAVVGALKGLILGWRATDHADALRTALRAAKS